MPGSLGYLFLQIPARFYLVFRCLRPPRLLPRDRPPPPLRAASLAFALTSAGKGGHGRGGEERRPGEGGGCAGAGERAEEGRLRQDGDAHHGQAEGELSCSVLWRFFLAFPPCLCGKKGCWLGICRIIFYFSFFFTICCLCICGVPCLSVVTNTRHSAFSGYLAL